MKWTYSRTLYLLSNLPRNADYPNLIRDILGYCKNQSMRGGMKEFGKPAFIFVEAETKDAQRFARYLETVVSPKTIPRSQQDKIGKDRWMNPMLNPELDPVITDETKRKKWVMSPAITDGFGAGRMRSSGRTGREDNLATTWGDSHRIRDLAELPCIYGRDDKIPFMCMLMTQVEVHGAAKGKWLNNRSKTQSIGLGQVMKQWKTTAEMFSDLQKNDLIEFAESAARAEALFLKVEEDPENYLRKIRRKSGLIGTLHSRDREEQLQEQAKKKATRLMSQFQKMKEQQRGKPVKEDWVNPYEPDEDTLQLSGEVHNIPPDKGAFTRTLISVPHMSVRLQGQIRRDVMRRHFKVRGSILPGSPGFIFAEGQKDRYAEYAEWLDNTLRVEHALRMRWKNPEQKRVAGPDKTIYETIMKETNEEGVFEEPKWNATEHYRLDLTSSLKRLFLQLCSSDLRNFAEEAVKFHSEANGKSKWEGLESMLESTSEILRDIENRRATGQAPITIKKRQPPKPLSPEALEKLKNRKEVLEKQKVAIRKKQLKDMEKYKRYKSFAQAKFRENRNRLIAQSRALREKIKSGNLVRYTGLPPPDQVVRMVKQPPYDLPLWRGLKEKGDVDSAPERK